MATGQAMGRLAVTYCLDAVSLSCLSLSALQAEIRSWRYRADPKGTEWVQRPMATIKGLSPFRDCDDRAIVVGAWAELAGLPFRFVAVGHLPGKPFHVFCEVQMDGQWFVADATYPTDRPNFPKHWGHRQVIFDRSQYAH